MNRKPFILKQSDSRVVQEWQLRDNSKAIDEAIDWLKSRAQFFANSNRRVVVNGQWQYGDEIILWDTLTVDISSYTFEPKDNEELPEDYIPTTNYTVSIEYDSEFYPYE